MKDELTLGALQRYEVAVLPNTMRLSDRQVSLLLSFVRAGGKVIAFGEIGTQNQEGIDVERPELKTLLEEGIHNYGLGKFVYMSSQAGLDYYTNVNGSIRRQFSEALRRLIYPNIQTSAGENMAILEYWNSKSKSIVLHLINYDYDLEKQQINSQKNIDIEVLLYEPLSKKNIAIRYSSPDWKAVERLKHETNGLKAKFSIRNLDFYGVVTIGQQGSVIPAINLLLD